jgi:alpha-1,2-mannosyltransferase
MINDSSKNAHSLLVLLIYVAFFITFGIYYFQTQFVDLPTFYYAARVVFVESRSPYGTLASPQVQTLPGQTIFPFLYPPPSLLALYPLSRLSYEGATKLILILNHCFILGFIYLFVYKVYPLERQQPVWTLALVYIFMFHPLAVTLGRGQINLLVLIFLCLAWYACKRNNHPGMIAFPLSLATLIKTYPAIFLLYFLIKKKYQTTLWFMGYLGLFTAIAYFLLPYSVWSDWIFEVLPTGGYGRTPFNLFSPTAPWNQSINGFTSRLFLVNDFSQALIPSPVAARAVPYILSGLIVLVTFALIYNASNISKADFAIDLEFSLLLVTMYLIAPISWEHHLVFVLPAAIIALQLLLSFPRRHVLHMFVVFSILLLAWRYPHWADILKQGIFTLGISAKFYAVVTMWFFFAIQIWKHTKPLAPTQHSVAQTETL